MSDEKLIELAERCEKATGPGDDLEWAIANAVGWRNKTWCPDYTLSLDAAMTLVPEDGNHFPAIRKYFNGVWSAYCYEQFSGSKNIATAATPALALCAASLKARAQAGAQTK